MIPECTYLFIIIILLWVTLCKTFPSKRWTWKKCVSISLILINVGNKWIPNGWNALRWQQREMVNVTIIILVVSIFIKAFIEWIRGHFLSESRNLFVLCVWQFVLCSWCHSQYAFPMFRHFFPYRHYIYLPFVKLS